MDVGTKLRAIRLQRGQTLRAIADQADLSESFLSQIERGQANASIASLKRIADALDVTMADLFEPDGRVRPRFLLKEDRPQVSFGILGRKYLLTPHPLDHLEVFVGELDPGGSTGEEPYAHGDSEELFLVISGRVQAQVGSQIYDMSPGDSIVYRSSILHRVKNVGEEVAEVVWVISPPSY